MRKASGLAGLAAVALFAPACLSGQALKVLHPSGAEHGFLVLQDTAGKVLASGELTQTLYNNNIKLRVVFQFRDGSVDDETTVFSQEGTFHLETDQHTQKGPSFPHPSYMVVDTRKQQVSVRDLSKDKLPVSTEHMVLPPDVANGLLFVLIQNLQANKPIEVPFVAFTPKPRMVKLAIAQEGEDAYRVAGLAYKATRYDIKVHIDGVAGIVAPMVGKQPADYHVWLSKNSVPVVLRVDGQLYSEGPVWSIRMASPVW